MLTASAPSAMFRLRDDSAGPALRGLSTLFETIAHISAIGVAGVAAFADYRTGRIPNWLTLPLLIAGPALWFATERTSGFLHSVMGILFCGLVPYFAFRFDEMFGGDVKLLAGLGGLTGPAVGIEIEFFSMLVGSFVALAILMKRGMLIQTFSNMFFMVFNPILPKKMRRTPNREKSPALRLGPFIFLGTCAAIFAHHPQWFGRPIW